MILLEESAKAWLTMVDAIYDRACANSGNAKLSHEIELQFSRHGELTTEVLPAGTNVFFPLTGSPQSDRRRAPRSKNTCAIMGEHLHLTLQVTTSGVKISSFKRMPSHSFA